MKITASQLRRIIKEEVKRARRVNLSEGNPNLEGFIKNNVYAEQEAIANIVENTLKELGQETQTVDDETGMDLVEIVTEQLIGVVLNAFQSRGM